MNIAAVRRYVGLPFCFPRKTALNLEELCARLIDRVEGQRYQELMQAHHGLGALPVIGETLWYMTTIRRSGNSNVEICKGSQHCNG